MNRGQDAMTGILLALIGIAILVAWRSGMLTRILGLAAPASSSRFDPTQAITRIGAASSASLLPTASITPIALSPQAQGEAAGTVDNGFSSTWVSSPSWVAFRESERAVQLAPAAVVSGGDYRLL